MYADQHADLRGKLSMQKFERGILMLVAGQVIWGISPVLIGLFLGGVPASLVLTIRHFIGGALFIGILLVSGRTVSTIRINRTLVFRLLFWSVLTSGLAEILWIRAIQDAGVIIATLLVRLEIPFAVVFAAWYLRERLTLPITLAAVLSISGVVLLTISRPDDGSYPHLLRGALEGFAGALLWTWAGVYAKKMLTDGSSPVLLAALRTWVGGLFNAVVVLLTIGTIPQAVMAFGSNQWLVILYLAVFSSVLGMLFYYRGMEYTSASVAGVLLGVSLLIATLGGLIIGERLLPLQWIGAVMIIVAIVLTSNVHGSLRRFLKLSLVTS